MTLYGDHLHRSLAAEREPEDDWQDRPQGWDEPESDYRILDRRLMSLLCGVNPDDPEDES